MSLTEIGSKIYIGPAGWSYPDWHGPIYPARGASRFSELSFLAKYFQAIEINTTFYQIPSSDTVQNWVRAVASYSRFKFCVKLWQKFTHEEQSVAMSEVKRFNTTLAPMVECNLIGALLIQFPWRFKYCPANLTHLQRLCELFANMPLVIEFRHASWVDDDVMQFLRGAQIAFANIDQPVIGKSVPLTSFVTSRTGYLRLHGRNYAHWFSEGAGRDARYDYLYSAKELSDLAAKARVISQNSDATFIIFNNHFRGQAVVNSLQMMQVLLEEKPVFAASILDYFPDLKDVIRSDFSANDPVLF